MNDIIDTFAPMKEISYDYHGRGLRFITAFDDLIETDTAQLDDYMILGCNGGKIEVDVNGTRVYLSEYQALILPPRVRLTNYMVSPDVRCDMAIIASDMVRKLLGNHIEEWDRAIYINHTNHIRTDEESRRQFICYAELLNLKLKQEGRYSQEVVNGIVRSILFDYLELMMEKVPQAEEDTTEGRQRVLFRQFIELLSTRHVKHQLVDTYAQELCVSPGYLTKVCKQMSGKTAMKWIREYTEQDVQHYLTNSDHSVKEICEELGFPNLSFFAKYCRRAFGCSPTEYRKRMRK
ncbi:helix-turn-helix domain-containing protein [Prevotella histicola]